ncbi:MAG: septum formation initiator family protein [Nitrospirae bacterium]|nr:septum formation initiator family protein [Nitrospirota bacterium]
MERSRTDNVRQQVLTERKIRNLIFFTIVFLFFLYIIAAHFFGEMGLLKFLELRKTKIVLQGETESIEKMNETLRREIKRLNDPFYIEKHAREEYNLARPDEYILQFQDDAR